MVENALAKSTAWAIGGDSSSSVVTNRRSSSLSLSGWLWCINRFRLSAGAGIEASPLPRAPMPYKHNEPRRHKIPKAKYKVSNWQEYDQTLQQRGSLTVWVTPEAGPFFTRAGLGAGPQTLAVMRKRGGEEKGGGGNVGRGGLCLF